MTNKKIISSIALFLSVIFLSFLACEKMEKHSPTAVDTTSQNLTKTTTSLSSLLSATPDIIVNSTSDVLDFSVPMQVEQLPGPDGLVTLREAITAANNTSGPQIIGFNIPTTDPGFDGKVFIIKPTTEGLPILEDEGTTINGATQAEFSGDTNPEGPEIVLNGSLLEPFNVGFSLGSSENNIHQFVINKFPACGIVIGGDNCVVTGCYIGVDRTGTSKVGNLHDGILIGGTNNRIGGYSDEERNIISGNDGAGIQMPEGSNLIVGNFIGTDVSGIKSVGNNYSGIAMGASNNRIIGNVIATNGWDGIFLDGSNNQIGGNSDEERNIILGNGHDGIKMERNAHSNLIVGNFIGTDATGTKSEGNLENGIGVGGDNNRIIGNVVFANVKDGIRIVNGSNNQIGGYSDEEKNIISRNGDHGIGMSGNSNLIVGNFIGTDVSGTKSVGNNGSGIAGGGYNNRILNNLISGNRWDGISLGESDNNELQGNLIGTDIIGNPTLGNSEFGVRIIPNSTGNHIGGKLINEGNTIADNGRGGIIVGDDNRPANNNTIEGNTIHHNTNGGILVLFQSNGIKISQNSIYSNDGLGIDLDWNGVTENDPGDGDTGTNNLMNFPVLTWAHAAPGQLVVKGEIDTPNPETVTIEFFANPVPKPAGDPSGHGEGAIFLGSKKPNPQGKFTATLSPVAVGTLITATATDANGNTSEFAANIVAVFP